VVITLLRWFNKAFGTIRNIDGTAFGSLRSQGRRAAPKTTPQPRRINYLPRCKRRMLI
jgi:hypothetical protein